MSKRANGEGSIYQYRDGFRASITTPEGQRYTKQFKLRGEASEWLNEQLHAIHGQQFVEPDGITVGEWLSIYIEDYARQRVRQRSYERLQQLSFHLTPLEKIPLQKLTNFAIQRQLNTLSEKYSAQTVKHVKNLIFGALKQAVIGKVVQHNVAEHLSLPKIKRPPIEVFTKDELEKIKDTLSGHRLQPFFIMLIATGMRTSEILGLRWQDIDFNRNTISVEQTLHLSIERGIIFEEPKSDSGRRKITVPANALKLLQPNESELVFTDAAGGPVRAYNIRRAWSQILKRSGIPHKGMHCIRHTHATLLIAAGEPVTEVCKRLGHSRNSTTLDIYAHAIKSHDEKIAEKVAEIFSI